jgi:aromatic-L-amino-acid/L-tryptophan decarboxylase
VSPKTRMKPSNRKRQPASLDLSPEVFLSALQDASQFACGYFSGVGNWPVFPYVSGKALRKSIQSKLPEDTTSVAMVLREFQQTIFRGIRHNLHPRFFGYVSSSGNPVGVLADLLTSTVNQNVTSWRSAPAAVEVELLVTDWIKEIVGYPQPSFGMLTSGGSMALLQALVIAREIMSKRSPFRNGLQSLGRRRMILYTSIEGHMSISKSAGILGLGKSAVHIVKTNEKFQMDLNDLKLQILHDRKRGDLPFCVVGTAGTVNTGAIDDLAGVARVCQREKLWFHVDAAYGGFAALAPAVKEQFKGIERADSVSLDPHKWLFQPLDAGCLLLRDRRHAHQTFSGSGDYARVIAGLPGEDFAFFEHGMELSRRFRALKIWMTLKCYGRNLLAGCVEQNLAIAKELGVLVEENAFLELMAPVGLSIVCFRFVPPWACEIYETAIWGEKKVVDLYLDSLNQTLMTRLQCGGVAYLSNAFLRNRFALRACIISYKTESRDVHMLVDEVVRLGKHLDLRFRRQLLKHHNTRRHK